MDSPPGQYRKKKKTNQLRISMRLGIIIAASRPQSSSGSQLTHWSIKQGAAWTCLCSCGASRYMMRHSSDPIKMEQAIARVDALCLLVSSVCKAIPVCSWHFVGQGLLALCRSGGQRRLPTIKKTSFLSILKTSCVAGTHTWGQNSLGQCRRGSGSPPVQQQTDPCWSFPP